MFMCAKVVARQVPTSASSLGLLKIGFANARKSLTSVEQHSSNAHHPAFEDFDWSGNQSRDC